MSTKTTKYLGLGVAAIAFLLVTIPVLRSGVVYADSDNHNNDHHDHNNDHHDHNNDHHDHHDHDHDHDHHHDDDDDRD